MLSPGNLFKGRRKCLVNYVNLRRVDGPFAIKAHTSSHLGITLAGLVITNRQRHTVNDSDASRASSGDAFGLGIVVVEKLLAPQFLRADIAREIDQAKDQPTHTRRRFGNLLSMQHRIGRLDQYLEPYKANLEAHVLFDLRQEAINEKNIFGSIALGNHYHVDVTSSGFDYLYQVAVEEFRANIVGPKSANLAPEVKRIERLHYGFARFDLLRNGTGIFQIEHDLVGIGSCGLCHHFQTMSWHCY